MEKPRKKNLSDMSKCPTGFQLFVGDLQSKRLQDRCQDGLLAAGLVSSNNWLAKLCVLSCFICLMFSPVNKVVILLVFYHKASQVTLTVLAHQCYSKVKAANCLWFRVRQLGMLLFSVCATMVLTLTALKEAYNMLRNM